MGKLQKQMAARTRKLEWAQQQWLKVQAALDGLPDYATFSVSLVSTPGNTRSTASFSAPASYVRKLAEAELVVLDKKMMDVTEEPHIAAPGAWTRGVP